MCSVSVCKCMPIPILSLVSILLWTINLVGKAIIFFFNLSYSYYNCMILCEVVYLCVRVYVMWCECTWCESVCVWLWVKGLWCIREWMWEGSYWTEWSMIRYGYLYGSRVAFAYSVSPLIAMQIELLHIIIKCQISLTKKCHWYSTCFVQCAIVTLCITQWHNKLWASINFFMNTWWNSLVL